MKHTVMFVLASTLLLGAQAIAQELTGVQAQLTGSKLRLCLTASSNLAAAPIGKSLDKHCPKVVITVDTQKANYLLEAVNTHAGKGRERVG